MKQKLLFLSFLLFSISAISQEKTWSNRLEFQVSASFTKDDYHFRFGNRPFLDFKDQTSINYGIGWNTAIRLNNILSLESGLSLIRRKSKNSVGFDGCISVPDNQACFDIYQSNNNRRQHLINVPLRIRLQKHLGDKLLAYLSSSMNNYFRLFTVYQDSDFQRKETSNNYYGYSLNTALGVRYPLSNRFTIDAEVNSRLFEKYKQAEITYGNPSVFDASSFRNINLMLTLSYYL